MVDNFDPPIPTKYKGKWYIGNIEVTLKELQDICKLTDEEMTYLVLANGIL